MASRRWGVQRGKQSRSKQVLLCSIVCQFEQTNGVKLLTRRSHTCVPGLLLCLIQILVLARSPGPLKEGGVVLRVRGAGMQAEGDCDPCAVEVLVLKAVQ
jgi:hypothetical protein